MDVCGQLHARSALPWAGGPRYPLYEPSRAPDQSGRFKEEKYRSSS
jgi:hypothetical protein